MIALPEVPSLTFFNTAKQVTFPNIFFFQFHQRLSLCRSFEVNLEEEELLPYSIPTEVIGSALYPTLALLNHSCKPNTIRFNRGSKVRIDYWKTYISFGFVQF